MFKKCAVFLCSAALLLARNASAQDIKVETYEPPKPLKTLNPYYPRRALSQSEEADVEVSMMVDASGKPFEITVVNATGSAEFKKAAIAAIENWTFAPASSNGQSVVGSTRYLLRFLIDGNVSASRNYTNVYEDFMEALKTQSQEQVEAKLAKLQREGMNHYENAFTNLAHFSFEQKFGSIDNQRHYLEAALSFSREKKDQVFLPKASEKAARRELLRLQVKSNYLREALDTYRMFGASGDNEALQSFKPVMEQIMTLANNDKSYELYLQLNDSGNGSVGLLKHKFFVKGAEGKLDEFKVRCEKKYVGFTAEPDISYDIPKEWGACSLEIIGSPGAKVQLTQQ